MQALDEKAEIARLQNMCRKIRITTTLLLVVAVLKALSQEPSNLSFSDKPDWAPEVTRHSIRLDGGPLDYITRAGYLSLRDEEHAIHGRMFYVSYFKIGPQKSDSKRPVIFLWNGGPGSNASLLHIGGVGPRRIDQRLQSNNTGTHGILDNEQTWLRFADLVFVDPIGTGYSYASSETDLKTFWSNSGDADAMAEFIRLYRSHYQVETRPLYICGESYGTFRAAGVADVLRKRHISLQGIVLLSSILQIGSSDHDVDASLALPSYAATAMVNHRARATANANIVQSLNGVQDWAEQSYLPALREGKAIDPYKKEEVAQRLYRYTGVDTSIWLQHDLVLDSNDFASKVLGTTTNAFVGHYDTRIVGHNMSADSSYDVSTDPSLQNGVENTIVDYLRKELHINSDMYYAGPWGGRWPSPVSPRGDWTASRWSFDGQADRSPLIANAMHNDLGLRVFMAAGYFDLATPFASLQHSVSQMNLRPGERERIEIRTYQSGHEIYMSADTRAQLMHDVEAFVGDPQSHK